MRDRAFRISSAAMLSSASGAGTMPMVISDKLQPIALPLHRSGVAARKRIWSPKSGCSVSSTENRPCSVATRPAAQNQLPPVRIEPEWSALQRCCRSITRTQRQHCYASPSLERSDAVNVGVAVAAAGASWRDDPPPNGRGIGALLYGGRQSRARRYSVRGSKLAKLLLQPRGLRHAKRNKRRDEGVDGRPQRRAVAEAGLAACPDGLHQQAPTAAHTVVDP